MEKLKFSGMDGIDEATISLIHVSVGQVVKKGDNLFDIEADKASDTITSPYDGKISKINFQPGDAIKTGDIIVEFNGSEATATNNDSELNDTKKTEAELVKPSLTNKSNNEPVLATPLARKIASDLGIDITTVKGTGPNGRVLKSDLENLQSTANSSTTNLTNKDETPSSVSTNKDETPSPVVNKMANFGPIEHVPLVGIRKAIANAMITSASTIPHVTLMLDLDATNLISLRETLKQEAKKIGLEKLTYLPFFIKAVALALKKEEFKFLNATLDSKKNEILFKKYYNIGMAVDTAKGLVVPVIKNADQLEIFEIAKQVNQLADKAKKGALTPADSLGGTFTITNFGSAGLKIGTPIINFPEVAILGIGTFETKPVLEANEVVFHKFFPLSLSIDHRVIDGAPAGYFLQELKKLLENPILLFTIN